MKDSIRAGVGAVFIAGLAASAIAFGVVYYPYSQSTGGNRNDHAGKIYVHSPTKGSEQFSNPNYAARLGIQVTDIKSGDFGRGIESIVAGNIPGTPNSAVYQLVGSEYDPALLFAVPLSNPSIDIRDINGDGLPDLIVAGTIPEKGGISGILPLYNTGDMKFSPNRP